MTEINNRFNSLYQDAAKDGKITQSEAQGLVKTALQDGILSKEEATVFYKIGKSLADTKLFDPAKLKKGDGSTVNKEVTELFTTGMASRTKEKNVISDLSNKAATTTDGMIGTIADYTASAVDFIGDMVGSESIKGLAKDIKSYNISTEEQANINSIVDKLDEKITSKIEEISFKAFDNTKCVGNALAVIAKNTGDFTNIPKDAGFVDVDLLKEWTGKNWDEISPADHKGDPAKLNGLFGDEIKKGQALVTDGGHAFVFDSFDAKTGLITATDPSENNKKVTFSKDSPALSIFVIGKGDGNHTPKDTKFSMVRTFDYMKKESDKGEIKNKSDVDDSGKGNESLEMRELFTFMGDPKQSEQFDVFKGLLNDAAKAGLSPKSIQDIKNFLNAKGITLDTKEIKQMAKTLTQKFEPPKEIKIPGILVDQKNPKTGKMEKVPFVLKVSSPLEMMDWLNKPKAGQNDPSTRSNTNTQNRYMRAVQYSNVDLTDYFSSSSDSKVKASNMMKVFADMMAGKRGC